MLKKPVVIWMYEADYKAFNLLDPISSLVASNMVFCHYGFIMIKALMFL